MESILDFLETFLLQMYTKLKNTINVLHSPDQICIKMKSHPGVPEFSKCLQVMIRNNYVQLIKSNESFVVIWKCSS